MDKTNNHKYMKTIVLKNIITYRGGVKYEYIYPLRYERYLSGNGTFFVEYPDDVKTESIPRSILAIPFVGNMLTVSMLLDIPIEVPELDETFYQSIGSIKAAYKRMFPYLRLNFDVRAVRVVDNTNTAVGNRKTLFFTGGLDATGALVRVADIHPTLVNIWGGDVSTTDEKTHANLAGYLSGISKAFDTDYAFIKYNGREMYNERKVTRLCATRILPWQNHGWWASFAHILSMVTAYAPYAYDKHVTEHYIASSYESRSSAFDANNETLLDAIRFADCRMVSVDKEADRTQKAKCIIDFQKKEHVSIKLKVCWYRHAGENCSECEKCYRTILDILVNHGNPNDFGFKADSETYAKIRQFVEQNYVNTGYWKPIQEEFRKERAFWMSQPDIYWILDCRFNRLPTLLRKIRSTAKKFL